MEIKVLQHHIDNAVMQSPTNCAIALAVRAQFPDAMHISVGIFVGVWDNNERNFRNFEHSAESRSFMQDFDNGKPVEPCILTFREGPLGTL